MVLWRISNYACLLGLGGMHASARFHTAGRPIVYLAESPSSALLEILVHLETDEEDRPDTVQLLKIGAEESVDFEQIAISSLSASWRNDELETQALGDAWLLHRKAALLRVPPAITPETWNLVVNPWHPDVVRLRIVSVTEHLYDTRLFNLEFIANLYRNAFDNP